MSRASVQHGRGASGVPPLQNGDRLTRREFERRYDATRGIKKAELIEGVVYMPPPVSFTSHSLPHGQLIGLLATYAAATPGVLVGDNGSLRLDLDNMPQPDAFLMISPQCGGQARIDQDDYVHGAPEFIGEIAATTASYDLHAKMQVYRRNGVMEYLVWRTLDREIDYFVLEDEAYQRVPLPGDGIWKSDVLKGLWIDGAALAQGDLARALETLRRGTGGAEHAAFVNALKR